MWGVFRWLVYKNASQRPCTIVLTPLPPNLCTPSTLVQVARTMDLVRQLQLPGMVADLDAMVQLATAAAVAAGSPSPRGTAAAKGSRPGRAAAAPSGGEGGGGGGGATRRTHRLPAREACAFVMAKLVIGEARRWGWGSGTVMRLRHLRMGFPHHGQASDR